MLPRQDPTTTLVRAAPTLLRRACLLLLLACACLGHAAPPSTLRFQHLGAISADELSTLSLLQDHQGFIWIGTNSGGLYRFDGYQAIKYLNNPANPRSLPHDRASALFEDKDGRIWVGTQSGLARFDPATNDFTKFIPPDGPPNRFIVKNIISDGKNGMWIGTWGGVQHLDPVSGKFVVYQHESERADSLLRNDVNALALDDKGGLWVATWPGGLDYLPAGGKGFVHYRIDQEAAPDTKLNISRSLFFDARGQLWIGTENGVVLWDSHQDWSTRRRLDTPHSRVTALFADRDQTVWAATMTAGLLSFEAGQSAPTHFVHRPSDPHSLPSDNVRYVMQDRGGMLWIATFTDGIALANPGSRGFARLIPFDGLDSVGPVNNSFQSIDGAPNGKLWLAGNSGFVLYDPVSGRIERRYRADAKRPGALSNDIVYSVYQSPGGPLWAGTSAGLNRLDKPDGDFKVIHFGNVASDYINNIAPGRGDVLWLATGNSLIRYDSKNDSYKSYFHDPSDPRGRSVKDGTVVLEDRQGRVWVGSEWNGGGLDILDPASGKFRHLYHDQSNSATLSDENVSALHEDAQGRLWAGTAKGLDQILTAPDGTLRVRQFGTIPGVGRVKVLSIESDAAGRIWYSTASGLSRLEPDSGQVTHYTATDGLTEGFGVNASFRSEDGTLYFGGVKGITAVSPAKVRSTLVAPLVAITDISVFNRSLSEGTPNPGAKLSGTVTAPLELTLSVQESVFSLEFAALHFSDPGRNRYAYRLEGFDHDWVQTDAGHRNATYTNLNPGQYRFQVKGSNDRGMWSERATGLVITILPPFWQTWWFRFLCALATLALLVSAYRLRVARFTRHQAELRELVAERTRELEESNRKLAALSTTDGLTGISNRRGFDSALDNEWRRAKRAAEPLALAMLDVDHFKDYNDNYGHQAGDECLRVIARLIASHARRTSDTVARYGGEEFALLTPATDAERAAALAQSVVDALAALHMPHATTSAGYVTVSIGVAALIPNETNNADMLVQLADQALYLAKQSGRNRVHLALDSHALQHHSPDSTPAL